MLEVMFVCISNWKQHL